MGNALLKNTSNLLGLPQNLEFHEQSLKKVQNIHAWKRRSKTREDISKVVPGQLIYTQEHPPMQEYDKMVEKMRFPNDTR